MTFTSVVDKKIRLDAIALDEAAIMRGGDIQVDLDNAEVELTPWGKADSDTTTSRVILPDGCTLGTPKDFLFKDVVQGVRYPLGKTDYALDIVDFQATKFESFFGDVTAPGIKQLLWVPVSALHDDGDGKCRPKRIQTGGRGKRKFYLQPDMTGIPDVTQPAWAINSLAEYGEDHQRHNIKRDGVLVKPYMTGKKAHHYRPLMAFWGGTLTTPIFLGYIAGALEFDIVTGIITKAFNSSDIQPYVAGGAVLASTDATIGYTTVGGSTINILSQTLMTLWYDPSTAVGYEATEAGTINTIHINCTKQLTGVNDTQHMAAYVTTGTGVALTGTLITDSEVQQAADRITATGSTYWNESDTAGGIFSSGNKIAIANQKEVNANAVSYDSTGSTYSTSYIAHTSTNPFPATTGVTTPEPGYNNLSFSAFLTYTAAAAGVIPQVMHHLNQMRNN